MLGASEVTPETWDDLEALLIQADLGVDTTEVVLERLEKRVDAEGLVRARDLQTGLREDCLLYTSDADDDLLCVDLGGRRIIKKKT